MFYQSFSYYFFRSYFYYDSFFIAGITSVETGTVNGMAIGYWNEKVF